jgi:hypothetical protein
MTERSSIVDALTRALKANGRYYEAWGRLASAYMLELADASAGVRLPRLSAVRAEAARPPVATAAPTTALSPAKAALVLEAEPGKSATGAFLVENTLGRSIAQPVEIGPFTDVSGRETDLALAANPGEIKLAAGEQVVVQVRTVVPEALEGECRGTLRVAEMPGTEIPIVVRRLPR